MLTSRLAVIDLGSNTFHLLLIEFQKDGQWVTLAKDRRYVKLAAGGIEMITPESIERALLVMKEFAIQINAFQVDKVFAIGTAALREAKNGMAVAERLTKESGIPIEIIDGEHEAAYILKGIQSALPGMARPCLIMDIGGGSVEFILYQDQKLLFAQSFRIGVAILFRNFHLYDPIRDADIDQLEVHLQTTLKPVFEALENLHDYALIGASGSFEVIQEFLPKIQQELHWSELDFSSLDAYLTEVIHTDWTSRKERSEIPIERVDYIVVAYILIRFILRSRRPGQLFYCDYALKEGVIAAYSESKTEL